MTAIELKQQLLKEAPKILRQYLKSAQGDGCLTAIGGEARKAIFEIIQQLILKAPELETIKAASTRDVIQLLGKGKITPEQAFKLMEILEKQQNIEELPKLVKKLQKAKVIK